MNAEGRAPPPMEDPPPLVPPEGFEARLREIGVGLDPAALARLGDYLARLLAMNAHMNLTAIEDPAEAWERHVLDALALLPLLGDLGPEARLVDVGSGGGVPGIPLAIARPDLQVTLVEATKKKAVFLEQVIAALGLSNVSVRDERAEVLGKGDLRDAFDVVTARAVAKLPALIPLAAPLARPGGRLLLIKGQRAEQELLEAREPLARHRLTHEKTIPTPTGKIVVLRRGNKQSTRPYRR